MKPHRHSPLFEYRVWHFGIASPSGSATAIGDAMTAAALLESDFATLPDLIRVHAVERGEKEALVAQAGAIHHAEPDPLMGPPRAPLHRDRGAQGPAAPVGRGSSPQFAEG